LVDAAVTALCRRALRRAIARPEEELLPLLQLVALALEGGGISI
jgi:hypothetical protein